MYGNQVNIKNTMAVLYGGALDISKISAVYKYSNLYLIEIDIQHFVMSFVFILMELMPIIDKKRIR